MPRTPEQREERKGRRRERRKKRREGRREAGVTLPPADEGAILFVDGQPIQLGREFAEVWRQMSEEDKNYFLGIWNQFVTPALLQQINRGSERFGLGDLARLGNELRRMGAPSHREFLRGLLPGDELLPLPTDPGPGPGPGPDGGGPPPPGGEVDPAYDPALASGPFVLRGGRRMGAFGASRPTFLEILQRAAEQMRERAGPDLASRITPHAVPQSAPQPASSQPAAARTAAPSPGATAASVQPAASLLGGGASLSVDPRRRRGPLLPRPRGFV